MILLATLLALAAPDDREPTEVFIRRLAGLPAETAQGEIRVTDVGHHPGDTMISKVARRDGKLWSVSYACAGSQLCTRDGGADHQAAAYTLSAEMSAEVDRVLAKLKTGVEPDGKPPSVTMIGGWLLVVIDDSGFRQTYRRGPMFGSVLGGLGNLLDPPGR